MWPGCNRDYVGGAACALTTVRYYRDRGRGEMPVSGDNQPTRNEDGRSGMWCKCKVHREADDVIWRMGITAMRVPL